MSVSYVVGVDLSLTSTGIAALDPATGAISTIAIRSAGKKTDRLSRHTERIMGLRESIVAAVDSCCPQLVVIESALFAAGRADSSAHRRAGLWWLVVTELSSRYRVVEVAPATLKKFVSGKGNSDKMAVGIGVAAVFGPDALPDSRSDRADAAGLAGLGSYALGGKGFGRAVFRDACIEKICWETVQGPVQLGLTTRDTPYSSVNTYSEGDK